LDLDLGVLCGFAPLLFLSYFFVALVVVVTGLDDEGWALRYHMESQLTHLSKVEEKYWRQRSRIDWLTKGDANTTFFHAFANARRWKCAITRLTTNS
jgi:hypothetical protein